MYKPGGEELVLLELEDELKKIRDRLIGGRIDRDVVSIVGMGGIGKTTMARRAYEELKHRFHVHAFCCVSQRYDKKQLLVELLSRVARGSCVTDRMSFEDLGEVLYRSLKGRRYLIVLDDMWEIGAWDDLGIYFPRDHNQSRILVTTRENDVALQIKSHSPAHNLRFLSEEESWELLEKKTFFHHGKCPPELLGVARKIAKRCKGLPIAIVVVAGILARIEQERDKWEKIAESVGKDAQIELFHIFELSYDHLPEQLKECFLYFAAYEEDSEIPVCKLIQYWVAEGFVPRDGNKCLEDLAEYYLSELIGRSLVMVSKRRSDGGIKTCHLHDFVHAYCLAKAKEVKFLQRWDGYAGMHSAAKNSYLSTARVCTYYRGAQRIRYLPNFDADLRSFLFFGSDYQLLNWYLEHDFSFICGWNNLQVLELYGIGIDWNFFKLELPVHLRYLGINELRCAIPESICNLKNLEMLCARSVSPYARVLPDTIWKMVKLTHLHVRGYPLNYRFVGLPALSGSNLENLQVLSGVRFHYGMDAERLSRALPRLRRLKCCLLYSDPQLDWLPLTQLESLNLTVCFADFPPDSEFNFPPNLKKLSLQYFKFTKDNISRIARLPNLEILKLVEADFEEENWYLEDDKFLKLKFLKLSVLNIRQWNATKDDFPRLEKLAVKGCCGLKNIPSCFGEMLKLKSIDLQGCSSSFESSVRQIQEVQKELGNTEFEVHIRD